MYLNENVQSIFSYIQTLFGFSSSGDRGRKRPLIVFDSSSTNTGSVKLKKPDPSPAPVSTDRLKPPVSSINLTNPIRKLSGTSTNSSSDSSKRTPVSSPGAGPKSPCNHSKTANSSVHSNNTMSNRKRTSPSDGEHNTSVSIKLTPWKRASLAWQVLCGVDCSDCNCFIFCGSRTLSLLIQRKDWTHHMAMIWEVIWDGQLTPLTSSAGSLRQRQTHNETLVTHLKLSLSSVLPSLWKGDLWWNVTLWFISQ